MKPIEVSDEVVECVIELILRREGETVPDVMARFDRGGSQTAVQG